MPYLYAYKKNKINIQNKFIGLSLLLFHVFSLFYMYILYKGTVLYFIFLNYYVIDNISRQLFFPNVVYYKHVMINVWGYLTCDKISGVCVCVCSILDEFYGPCVNFMMLDIYLKTYIYKFICGLLSGWFTTTIIITKKLSWFKKMCIEKYVSGMSLLNWLCQTGIDNDGD